MSQLFQRKPIADLIEVTKGSGGLQRTLGAEVRLELPADLSTPGFYEVQRDGHVLTTLAFNQDKR